MSAPSPQASRQVESDEHDSEHEPVQRMSHVAPSLQLTLPLAPSVITHVDPPEQSMLHDVPQVPLHWLSSVHPREQLLPAQLEPSMSHSEPASQVQDVPEHVGGGASLPQAEASPRATKKANPAVIFIERSRLQPADPRSTELDRCKHREGLSPRGAPCTGAAQHREARVRARRTPRRA
jgi:hypothetical protein